MPQLPRRFIDNYTSGINDISAANRAALARELAQVDYSDMTAAANKVVGIMERHCELSAQQSARLAQTFYRGMSAYQTGEDFDAKPHTGRKSVATEKATRGIFQLGVDGNFEDMFVQLTDRLDYETKKAAGETVMRNARSDRRRPRFARVPSGSETCLFCLMLASRGPVYWTSETAGEENHYHANCDCRIVPVWGSVAVRTEKGAIVRRGGFDIEGYDPDEYFDRYLGAVRSGVRFRSESRWHTMLEYSQRGSKKARNEYLSELLHRSRLYLEGATDYNDFMERAKSVQDEWNALDLTDKLVSPAWDSMRRIAIETRKRFMDE